MPDARARFGTELGSVSEARQFVRRVLREWDAAGFEEAASYLVTELGTNSVIHARTGFEVEMSFDGRELRLGVSDLSDRIPIAKPHSDLATTGRGLSLVAAFADSWWIEERPTGKAVWATVTTESDPEPERANPPAANVVPFGRPGQGSIDVTSNEGPSGDGEDGDGRRARAA